MAWKDKWQTKTIIIIDIILASKDISNYEGPPQVDWLMSLYSLNNKLKQHL